MSWLYLFLLMVLLLLAIYLIEYNETADSGRTLAKDGFQVFRFNASPSRVFDILPPHYQFIDYEYVIKSTALTTFHRDVTSSQRVYHCKYPVYTMIIYEYSGNLLSVCPNSEKTWPFVWSQIVNISGPSGTAVLFNSEVLHAGIPNRCAPRVAKQYKLCHRDDVKTLTHLAGIRVTKNTDCSDTAATRFKRTLSYYFAFPINHWFYPFLLQKWREDTWMGWLQSQAQEHQFYNNV